MAAELRIAQDLSLPLDVLTEAVGIIATRGAGKTYGSVVLIEEAHAVGVPFVTPTSGTFSDYKSALSRHGLIAGDGGGAIRLTDAGVELAGDHVGAGAPPPSELKAMWESKLKAGARRMLDVLCEAYPDGVSRDDLAERAEITRGSGTFSDYLSALRRNNLAVDRGGLVYCGDSLFLGGRR